MGVRSEMPNSTKSEWTSDKDAQVVAVMSKCYPQFFDPCFDFSDKKNRSIRFSMIKKHLPDLNENAKQIRERWENHLSPKLKSSVVLKEDAAIIKDLCIEHTGDWAKISRLSMWVLGGRGYSANAIKNFFHISSTKRKSSPADMSEEPKPKKIRLDRISPILKNILPTGDGLISPIAIKKQSQPGTPAELLGVSWEDLGGSPLGSPGKAFMLGNGRSPVTGASWSPMAEEEVHRIIDEVYK